jgi:hypothetical protein
MSAPDGMIAAIAKVHGCPLATRNTADFAEAGIGLINPGLNFVLPANAIMTTGSGLPPKHSNNLIGSSE